MPNIASVLKDEISRLARKEIRSETDKLKKSSIQYRSDIASLKKQVASIEAALKKSLKRGVPASAAPVGDEENPTTLRFNHEGLASHRKRLALSAEQFGRLVGVSGQSIYKWETGATRPRSSQLSAIAAVRKMGKKEARAALDMLGA